MPFRVKLTLRLAAPRFTNRQGPRTEPALGMEACRGLEIHIRLRNHSREMKAKTLILLMLFLLILTIMLVVWMYFYLG